MSKYMMHCIILALIYFAFSQFSLFFSFEDNNTSPVWLPTGLAISWLYLFGFKYWPALFIGALSSNIFNFSIKLTLPDLRFWLASTGVAIGSLGEAITAAWLIKRYAELANPFSNFKSVFLFCAILCFSCLISASIGTYSLIINGITP